MKARPPYAITASSVCKGSLCLTLPIEEPDAPERRPVSRGECHADLAQRRDTVWHEAFAAGFVDGRLRPVRDDDLQASLARGYGGGKPGRPAANNEEVRFRGCGALYHWSRIISAQKPGPIARSTP